METTIAEIMTPISQVHSVAPQTEIWDALTQMNRNAVNHFPVMADGQILGDLSRENVISYVRTLQEFETRPQQERLGHR